MWDRLKTPLLFSLSVKHFLWGSHCRGKFWCIQGGKLAFNIIQHWMQSFWKGVALTLLSTSCAWTPCWARWGTPGTPTCPTTSSTSPAGMVLDCQVLSCMLTCMIPWPGPYRAVLVLIYRGGLGSAGRSRHSHLGTNVLVIDNWRVYGKSAASDLFKMEIFSEVISMSWAAAIESEEIRISTEM